MKTNHLLQSNNFIAVLLLLEVCCVLVPFFILGSVFDFPDILRQPAAKAFALFHQNRQLIVPTYYIFLVSALLYFPIASLLRTRFKNAAKNAAWLDIMQVAGIATGVFQSIGFSRWILNSLLRCFLPQVRSATITSSRDLPYSVRLYSTVTGMVS